jgi:hypothetical protein
MISNIWKSKPKEGPKKGSDGPGEGMDVLQSIVEGMDVFLKTYSDYSGVEDSEPLANGDDDGGEADEEPQSQLDLSSLSINPDPEATSTLPRPPPTPSNDATVAVNQPLQFDPNKLMSLLMASSRQTDSPSSSPVKATPRATLDQPVFRSTEESMRKSNVLSLQSNTAPLPLKPTLSTPNSLASNHRDREAFDLSSRLPSAATPQSKARASPRAVVHQTSLQPHRLSVTFDADTSVLSGVAYAMTPPRSVRSPPKLPHSSTPHPQRTFSDEDEEEEEEDEDDDGEESEEEDQDSQRDSDDEDEDEEDKDVDDETYMREYMVRALSLPLSFPLPSLLLSLISTLGGLGR